MALDNQLLQMMLALGGDISKYGADTDAGLQFTNTNNALMQNMKTQGAVSAQEKYLKWLQQFLDPSGSKVTLSKDGINASFPQESDIVKSLLGGEQSNAEDFYKGIGAMGPLPKSTPITQGGAAAVNPFDSSLPNFSASDLAGLSPEDVSNALGGALNIVGMKQKLDIDRGQLADKKVQDLFNMMYQGKLMENIDSEIRARKLKEGEVDPLDQPFAINALGLPEGTSLRQWNSLPEDEKRYQLYVYGTQKIIGGKPLSKEEFESLKPPEQAKFLEYLSKNPKMFAVAKELEEAKSVKVNVGEVVKKQGALNQLEAEDYFTSGKLAQDLNKYMESPSVLESLANIRRTPVRGGEKPNTSEYISKLNKAKIREKLKFIHEAVSSRNGTITNSDWVDENKDTIVWTVKWSSGRTTTFKTSIK